MMSSKRSKLLAVSFFIWVNHATTVSAAPSFLEAWRFNASTPYKWRCFPANKIKYSCRKFESDEPGQYSGDLTLVAKDAHKEHKYFVPRAIPLKNCRAILADWQWLLKDQAEVCLLGWPSNTRNGPPSRDRYWAWEQLLTAKGCSSWFGRWCEWFGPPLPPQPTLVVMGPPPPPDYGAMLQALAHSRRLTGRPPLGRKPLEMLIEQPSCTDPQRIKRDFSVRLSALVRSM